MLLYRTLRLMLRGALNVFFVEIESFGEAQVPPDGPLIFAANHPNSIMDTVILGTRTSRTVHYMARSGLFDQPAVAWVFDRCGVIPVYRAQDDPGQTGRNAEAFEAAYAVLAQGGCIGIFPEGRNAPERQVRDLKSGTARIALGASARHPERPARVVPVGLNFENRDRFLSKVLVRFGAPIDVSAYLDGYRDGERNAVRALTEEIQTRLRAVAVHIAEQRSVELVEDIHRIYGHTLLDTLAEAAAHRPDLRSAYLDRLRARGQHEPTLEDRFYLKQRIADALTFFESRDPARVEAVRAQVRRYKENLGQVKLRLDFGRRPPETLSNRREAAKLTLYAVLMAPVFLWGLLNNGLPFWLTGLAVLRAPDEAMRAFTGMLAGTLLFGLFYAAQGWGVWLATGTWWHVLLYLLSLPVSGLWALRYRRELARRRDRIVVRTLFLTGSAMMRQLLAQRERLLLELDALRETFMQAATDLRVASSADQAALSEAPPG